MDRTRDTAIALGERLGAALCRFACIADAFFGHPRIVQRGFRFSPCFVAWVSATAALSGFYPPQRHDVAAVLGKPERLLVFDDPA